MVSPDYYSKLTVQPVDFIMANNLNFLEGNVIKYVSRHRAKNGREDLEKAIHCLQLLISYEYEVNPD